MRIAGWRGARGLGATLGIAAALLAAPLARIGAQCLPRGAGADTTRVLEAFDPARGWTAAPSDGVSLSLHPGGAAHGHGLRLDFDFHGHAGYAVIHRTLELALPANYAFSFRVRGTTPIENLEFKLIDSSGDNVWWHDARDFHFPHAWRRVTLRKRDIAFAWGPRGGGDLAHVAALEFSITAGGGRGTVWLDDLTFTPLPAERPYAGTPRASASSSAPGRGPGLAVDGDSITGWRSARLPANGHARFTLDFKRTREYSGAVIDWAPGAAATRYTVERSCDSTHWTRARTVRHGNGGRDWLYLPGSESRYLRLRLLRPRHATYGIRELTVEPLSWAPSRNAFFARVAAAAPPGSYPRYLSNVQTYWTVVGVSGDLGDALVDETGTIEPHAGGFSVAPFLRRRSRLITWHDVRRSQTLARGYLPMPSVRWTADSLALTVTVFASGRPGTSTVYARYRVTNHASRTAHPTLYLAIRSFQVNPPWQFLGTPGGVAPVRRIDWHGGIARVNGKAAVVPLTRPTAFGAASFDEGGIVPALRRGVLPRRQAVADATAHASAAMAWPLVIAPGGTREIDIAMPLHPPAGVQRPPASDATGRAELRAQLASMTQWWRSALGRVRITLPPSAARIANTLRSTLAYMLIERDGAALRPGSRAYARSWIRDGSMMSAALLRLGHARAVRDYLDWYAPFQFADGKVPCCVDHRGADPVPENDSNGELIYAIANYFRFTGDTAFLERMWPHVDRAVAFMDSLRRSQMTPRYDIGTRRAFYGLMPRSISHEGYSAHPEHSYWDDLFALRGYADAAMIASALHHPVRARHDAAVADTFRTDILASYRRSMTEHHIDYLPGSADLGDFDPSSTTVALAPAGMQAVLPQAALHRTFDAYWAHARARTSGDSDWKYTPYELRTVGTFLRLGEKSRALAMLHFFLAGQRPPAWNAWAEVVWHDPATPRFIGDMPHAWVGSDFVRSALDLFAYQRPADSALVVGAGIPAAWVTEAPGVTVHGLRTIYGPLDLRLSADGGNVRIRIAGLRHIPPGGIVVRSPRAAPLASASVNGRPVSLSSPDELVVRGLPADVELTY